MRQQLGGLLQSNMSGCCPQLLLFILTVGGRAIAHREGIPDQVVADGGDQRIDDGQHEDAGHVLGPAPEGREEQPKFTLSSQDLVMTQPQPSAMRIMHELHGPSTGCWPGSWLCACAAWVVHSVSSTYGSCRMGRAVTVRWDRIRMERSKVMHARMQICTL